MKRFSRFVSAVSVFCLLVLPSVAAEPETTGGEEDSGAAVSGEQIAAFVEALRLAAPDTGREDDGLYSDWQIKPDNITRWSKRCHDAEVTPEEFEADAALARQILECKMGTVLSDQFEDAEGDEAQAVRRAAAWWMTGDPGQYDTDWVAKYTQKVLGFYQDALTSED